jgi:N-acetylmuramoyl-L-alanine amidase
VEKDLTLELARATQSELQRQGLNVILTRDGDDNPSFDDRATLANTPRLAIFVTFHVSSTGPPGTARVYFEHFSAFDSVPVDSTSPSANAAASQTAGAPGAAAQRPAQSFNWRPGRVLVPWTEAQRSYLAPSQRLADLVQAALAPIFHGSPDKAGSFAIRDLRSVAAPAVAIELSSVSSLDQASIQKMTGPLAASVARAIVQFRPGYERQQHP